VNEVIIENFSEQQPQVKPREVSENKYNISIDKEKEEITLCNTETGECQLFPILENAFRKLFKGGKRITRKIQKKRRNTS
jgi:hypothetical protein